MKMAEFKALSVEEQLIRLNKHLLNLKGVAGRLEDNFKCRDFDFSYSLLKKSAKDIGITVDGKNYVAFKTGEQTKLNKDNIVKKEQKVVNNGKIVKQQQDLVNVEELSLTKDEILFVKTLFKQDLVYTKQTLLLPQFVGAKKTTGISVYVELWERWGDFKKQYPMYSGTDLMALALEEFMKKYDER